MLRCCSFYSGRPTLHSAYGCYPVAPNMKHNERRATCPIWFVSYVEIIINAFLNRGKIFLVLNYAPRPRGVLGSGGIAAPLLTSAVDGSEWSALRPCCFTPGERAPDAL
jgi:hypothetical protein